MSPGGGPRQGYPLRRAVVGAVAAQHAPVIVDVVFTTIEEFAAPTMGFVIDLPVGATQS